MNREITAKEASLLAIKKAQGNNQLNQLENIQTLSPVRRAGEISNMSTESANLFQSKQGDIMATATRTSSNTKWVLPVLIIIGTIVNQVGWIWHDRSKEDYNNTPAGLEEIAIRKIEANTKMLAKIANPDGGNSFLSGAGGKSVNKAVPMFDCSTLEKRDSGFASEAIQTLGNSDAIYRLNPGCARIVMTEKMADSLGSLQAPGQYIFRQKDQKDGGQDRYVGCGTIDGRNDSPSSCLSYLKIRAGQVLEVINVNQDVILK